MKMYIAERDIIESNDNINILSVCFEPTNRCSAGCSYCLIENHQKEPTTESLINSLDKIMNYGVMRIGFGGGEPLLREDIYVLGRHVKGNKVGSLLRTSGMFPLNIEYSKSSFDWIDLSMDSIDKVVFNECRPNISLDILKRNIELLSNANINIRVSILLTRINVSTLEQTIQWLADKSVRKIRFQKIVSRGRAKKNWDKLNLSEHEYNYYLSKAKNWCTNYGIDFHEMISISNETLCIIKPFGEIFLGTPTGSIKVGHIDSSQDFLRAGEKLRNNQRINYSE